MTPIIPSNNLPDSPDTYRSLFRDTYFSVTMSKGYLFWLSFLMILTLGSRWIPLSNTLGYEFSAFIAVVLFVVTAIFITGRFAKLKPVIEHRSPFSPGPHSRIFVWGVILGVLAAMFWLWLLPLVGILAVGMIFSIRNCDPATGFLFYLFIPVVTVFFSAAISAAASLTSGSKRVAINLIVLVAAGFFLRLVIRIAFGHVMNPLDPILGFIVLPMYESETNFTTGFALSRLMLFVISIFIINISILFADSKFQSYRITNFFTNFRSPDSFLSEIQTILVTLILITLGFWFQGPLGMEITRNYLHHELNGMVVTDHFIIRYPTGGEVEDDIDRLADDHEFFYYQIFREIGVAPDGPIRAYIYPDRRTKTRLTGAGGNVYAKPWTGEIHVEYSRNTINALKHELVHVISAPMGVPVFGSSTIGGYGEGIAEGIEWSPAGDMLPHAWAAALREADDPYAEGAKLFPRDVLPNTLFPENTWWFSMLLGNGSAGGFYGGRLGLNYTVSASHTRWFLDEFGIEAYRKVYIRNNTQAGLGMSSTEVAELWMEYLDHVPVMQSEIDFAFLAYSPPKFTMRVCAHELAEHQRLALEHTQKQDWEKAFDEYAILVDFSPGNISYGYQQAKMLFNQEMYDETLEFIAGLKEWESADASWQAYLTLLEGDTYARLGQLNTASLKYQEALDGSLNQSGKENVLLRFEVLNSPAMDEYLAAFKEIDNQLWRYELARELDDTWLPFYYIGSKLVADRNYVEAQEMLLECLRKNPSEDFVRRNCLYYLGICAYRNEEYSLARQNFQDAGVIAQEMYVESHPAWDGVIRIDRLAPWVAAVGNWLEKCDWKENQ